MRPKEHKSEGAQRRGEAAYNGVLWFEALNIDRAGGRSGPWGAESNPGSRLQIFAYCFLHLATSLKTETH